MQEQMVIKPVPEGTLVEIASQWSREVGVNPTIIAHLAEVKDHEQIEYMTAVIFNFVYYSLTELIHREFIAPAKGGHVALLRLVRAAHKADHAEDGADAERKKWRKLKKRVTDIYAVAYLDILFPQPQHWNSLWRQVALASGYEGFSMHDVIMSILLKGLGITDMEGRLVAE